MRNPIIALATSLLLTAAAAAQLQFGCQQLTDVATYQEGCLDPCDCILYPQHPLSGTFNLREIYIGGATCVYALEDIDLRALPLANADPVSTTFRGRGVQRIFLGGAEGIEVNTRLLLSVDDRPARIFKTAPGAVGNPFVEFRTLVADNDFLCSNIVLDLAAAPLNGSCPQTLCPCDYTADGDVDIADLLLYLELWFDHDLLAEQTQSLSIEIDDLLTYLECWFPAAGSACP